jgi:hypothetical protein
MQRLCQLRGSQEVSEKGGEFPSGKLFYHAVPAGRNSAFSRAQIVAWIGAVSRLVRIGINMVALFGGARANVHYRHALDFAAAFCSMSRRAEVTGP